MRSVEEVIADFDITKTTDRKKIQLIEWFQKHPGARFDVVEVYAALGEELDVGQKQIRNYLNDLAEEDVLQRHGEKRISYGPITRPEFLRMAISMTLWLVVLFSVLPFCTGSVGGIG